MKKLKIAMLTNNYLPFIGGVPISIDRLATSLRSLGHTVYIFAPAYNEESEEEFVVRFKSNISKENGFALPNVLSPVLLNKFEEIDFDLIHAHHPYITGNIANILKKLYDIPLVYTYHTRLENYIDDWKAYRVITKVSPTKVDRYIKNTRIPTYTKRYCNKCELVIAPSESILDYLRSIGVESPIKVLPTGLSDANFNYDEELVKSIKAKYQANNIFISVMRLSYEKNINELIDNVKLYYDNYNKDFIHLIIGDGPLKELLTEKINLLGLEKNIILLGSIENKKIASYYKASDIFLFTSKSETQGMVVLEAMASKNPVVAYDASGVRDVVTKNNGILAFNQKEFVLAIDKLVSDKDLYLKASEEAYKTALNNHSDMLAKEMLIGYQEALVRRILK